MVIAELGARDAHGLLEQRLRLVESALRLDGVRQIVQRDGVFGMRLAKDAAMDRERFAQQRFGGRRHRLCASSTCARLALAAPTLG